ncbi:MAG: hypothetical protein VXZ82_01200 [Planctomycetota bacterium]|nr:hypothetical protein [Planctomycetota bacterium]
MKVNAFVVSYSRDGHRFWWPGTLSKENAFAIGRVFDQEGLDPRVVKARINPAKMFEAAESTRMVKPKKSAKEKPKVELPPA